jgi:hypothetical protein
MNNSVKSNRFREIMMKNKNIWKKEKLIIHETNQLAFRFIEELKNTFKGYQTDFERNKK